MSVPTEFYQPIATLFAALLILFGGVIAYKFQRKIDRLEKKREAEVEAYHEYITAICDDIGYQAREIYKERPDFAMKHTFEITRLRIKASTFASGRILDGMNKVAASREGGKPIQEYLSATVNFVHLVRVECFDDRQLSKDKIRDYMPFNVDILEDRDSKK